MNSSSDPKVIALRLRARLNERGTSLTHSESLELVAAVLDREHRFGEEMPLYPRVSREGHVLHPSEHHGDATPDRPRTAVWGADLAVSDPFGNGLILHTPTAVKC